jgi:hypothetical protein
MPKKIPPPTDTELHKFQKAKRRRDELHEKSSRTGLSDDEAMEQKQLKDDLAQSTRETIERKQK